MCSEVPAPRLTVPSLGNATFGLGLDDTFLPLKPLRRGQAAWLPMADLRFGGEAVAGDGRPGLVPVMWGTLDPSSLLLPPPPAWKSKTCGLNGSEVFPGAWTFWATSRKSWANQALRIQQFTARPAVTLSRTQKQRICSNFIFTIKISFNSNQFCFVFLDKVSPCSSGCP